MADDEEADAPAEGEEIPEEGADDEETEEAAEGAADAGDEDPEEDESSEEAPDEEAETADQEDEDEEDEEDEEAAEAEDEETDAEAAEDEGDEDDAPEEAADAEDEGDEIPEEDPDEEAAEAAEEEEEVDGELEEIETAMAGEGEEDEEEPPSQPTVKTDGRFYGTGRRKEAVARVWIEAGSGDVTVNGSDLGVYFSSRAKWTKAVRGPLECLDMEDAIDVWATAGGGGLTGQAEAIELGLARALVDMDENARHWLRPEGHLTRDDREVERKKINQPGARAKSQVSKR